MNQPEVYSARERIAIKTVDESGDVVIHFHLSPEQANVLARDLSIILAQRAAREAAYFEQKEARV